MDKNILEIKIPIEENLEDSLNIGIFDNEQLKRFVEIALFNPLSYAMYNSINENQRKCKSWLLNTLSLKSPNSILVLGGWYGGLAAMLKRKYRCQVRSIDIDPDCKRVGRKIYNEFIQFRGMDPSHVAMIDLNWPNASFEKYECDKPFKLTVRVEELSKLIKRAAQKNRITISATDNEYLTIKLENGHKREFKIRLIESSHTPSPVPKLALNSKFEISKTNFIKIKLKSPICNQGF